MLSYYTSSFLVSPSLPLKPMKHRLNLRSSYLGASTRVSRAQLTTWLTTWRTFLAITVVHLGSSVDIALVVIDAIALRTIS